MTTVVSNNDEGSKYSLTFDLLNAETYADNHWEGWVTYDLSLSKEDILVTECSGTILAGDVMDFIKCFQIKTHSKEECLPLEPDFELKTERFDDGDIFVSCFIDDGHRVGIYNSCGIALRFTVDDFAAKKFADEIAQRYQQLTNGLERSD